MSKWSIDNRVMKQEINNVSDYKAFKKYLSTFSTQFFGQVIYYLSSQ